MKAKFNKKLFASKIKTHRKIFGINLRLAGKQTKTSAATLSRLENGKPPEIETFLRVCEWLSASPMQFIS